MKLSKIIVEIDLETHRFLIYLIQDIRQLTETLRNSSFQTEMLRKSNNYEMIAIRRGHL